MIKLTLSTDGKTARYIGDLYGYTTRKTAISAGKREAEKRNNCIISVVDVGDNYSRTLHTFTVKDYTITEKRF